MNHFQKHIYEHEYGLGHGHRHLQCCVIEYIHVIYIVGSLFGFYF